ncbi:Zn-ribbon domain-containing protein [Methanohalobium sp.]|uniref:Zn-ribbon domain-containing protein n=1 Tax=Methanohalobium sp. TaxID=2837493 RepID=UPI0025E48FB4|nr:Zn-ribbon domain-containing protein [Methanohalobium sp.]
MPHKCTKCEQIFEDGNSVILNGCPNCGWNKFLYVSNESQADTSIANEEQPSIDNKAPESTNDEKLVREVNEVLGTKTSKLQKSSLMQDDDRVESVRILGPGSYELNLSSIMERKEIIMAIKENGTYALHLPSVFDKKKK